ncbi:MAG: glycosyltransferase family 4 protein [Thermoanaerobaculia bacterium]
MKILLVSTAWPWPTRKGHQLRLLQLANGLARWHEVTLLVPAAAGGGEPGAREARAFAIETFHLPRLAALPGVGAAFLGGRSLESGLVASGDLRRRLRELAPRFDRVVLQLVRLAGVTDLLAGTPWVLDLVDSLSLNLERRAALDRFWMRPLLRFEARRLAADERRMIAASALALLVSERDRHHLAAALPAHLAARLEVVPLALPPWPASALPGAPPATAAARVRPQPPAGECELAITGNLGYFPTVRGIGWFLDQVWPEVARKYPRARLLVAGARPPRGLARRVRRLGGRLIADPADLPALLAGSDVALAPLFAGSGTPIKLLEALAAAMPAVATAAAAEALDPALARCVAIPEDAASWVTTLHGLIANPVAAHARAAIGARLMHELHDPERIARALSDLLERPLPPV